MSITTIETFWMPDPETGDERQVTARVTRTPVTQDGEYGEMEEEIEILEDETDLKTLR